MCLQSEANAIPMVPKCFWCTHHKTGVLCHRQNVCCCWLENWVQSFSFAAVPSLAALLAGEAMVAAQALSLLAWDAAATFLLNSFHPALVTPGGALRPEAVGLFVEGLLVRSLKTAARI